MTDRTAEALERVRERLEAREPGHVAKLRERQSALLHEVLARGVDRG